MRNLLMPFPIFGHFRALTGISVKIFGRCPARNFATVVLYWWTQNFRSANVAFEGISYVSESASRAQASSDR